MEYAGVIVLFGSECGVTGDLFFVRPFRQS